VDTVAVAIAGRNEPVARKARTIGDEPLAWAAAAHALDYDDLHMESTTHISAVCVPAALAVGGRARAYLAGAGVMARLGTALGWPHYSRGWHATCTAGAPAAAVTAGIALGLTGRTLATAMALAIPSAGGIQRSFGTMAKPLQVGFAVSAGIRAARLAKAGVGADHAVLEDWMRLVGGDPETLDLSGPAVPGGLAIKIYPCCYALQRPMAAVAAITLDPATVTAIRVRTPAHTLQPLNRHRPKTGLEGKFSLEYGIATALLDRRLGFAAFSDASVNRPEAQRLAGLVTVEPVTGPSVQGLLDGDFEVVIEAGGKTHSGTLTLPPGAPGKPASDADMVAKVADCCGPRAAAVIGLDWVRAAPLLREALD